MDQNTMTKQECLEKLGLPENADEALIKQRYGALLRSYKHKIDEKGATYEDLAYYEDISLAYDTLMGFDHEYGDDNPASPVPYKIRKKWGKFLTIFETYWLAFALVAAVIILATTFIVQTIQNGEEDLIIKFVGAYAQDPTVEFTENLNERSENFENTNPTFFTVTTDTTMLDYSARSGAENFEAQLMSPGGLDVILIDKESFDAYIDKNIFVALDDYIAEYIEENGNSEKLSWIEYESEPDEQGNIEIEQGIYGLYVTDTTFFDDLGLTWLYDEESGQEKTMIFCIARNCTQQDEAWKFAEELLEAIE